MKLNRIVALVLSTMFFLTACSKDDEQATQEEPKVLEELPTYVIPEIDGEKVNFTEGNVTFQVDAENGGRVSSLKFKGTEILSLSDDKNWGSTFWISPQALWGWPQPDAFDVLPYDLVDSSLATHPSVILEGQKDDKTGVRFTKSFAANTSSNEIELSYTIHNENIESIELAPWEVTRVPFGGITVFPSGSVIDLPKSYSVIDSLGGVWVDYSNGTFAKSGKIWGESSKGWIAHINNGIVLIKKFENIAESEAAPKEAEVEIYVAESSGYIEVEQQGKLKTLEVGGAYDWNVQWKVVELPDSVSNGVSTALLQFIESEI